jgi:hypothetical protein
MTEINHEKRNRLGKVGPAFDNFRDNDPTGRKGQFLNQIAIEEVGVGPTIRKRKEQEREEQRKIKADAKAKRLDYWTTKIDLDMKHLQENEHLIIKLAYELEVLCRHEFPILQCSDCKNSDFRDHSEFERLMARKKQLQGYIKMAEAEISSIESLSID